MHLGMQQYLNDYLCDRAGLKHQKPVDTLLTNPRTVPTLRKSSVKGHISAES